MWHSLCSFKASRAALPKRALLMETGKWLFLGPAKQAARFFPQHDRYNFNVCMCLAVDSAALYRRAMDHKSDCFRKKGMGISAGEGVRINHPV